MGENLNLDRVWARVSQRPGFQRYKGVTAFFNKVDVLRFTLTTGQVSAQTPQLFPAGGIITKIVAAARISANAATVVSSPGLDMFSVAIDQQNPVRNVVGSSAGLGSSVFGPFGDSFPQMEIVMPPQGGLLYTVTNETTSTIVVTFAHHYLLPGEAMG